jgi:DNA-directed RNA polymerase subunit RPC12/RpoP
MPSIQAKCKKCGRQANAEAFVLDYDFKMMVCPQCIKEKRLKKEVRDELAKEANKHTPGWDSEDEYLERTYKSKVNASVKVTKLDDEKVRYKCPKCNYEFIYDIDRKVPGRCPYCTEDIHELSFR